MPDPNQNQTREYMVKLSVIAYFEAENNHEAELQFWDTFHYNSKDLDFNVVSYNLGRSRSTGGNNDIR